MGVAPHKNYPRFCSTGEPKSLEVRLFIKGRRTFRPGGQPVMPSCIEVFGGHAIPLPLVIFKTMSIAERKSSCLRNCSPANRTLTLVRRWRRCGIKTDATHSIDPVRRFSRQMIVYFSKGQNTPARIARGRRRLAPQSRPDLIRSCHRIAATVSCLVIDSLRVTECRDSALA